MTSRRLEVIGEHTVDVSLLTPGGWVLDAGCRDFTFARGLRERGCNVIALDPDPTIEDPHLQGVAFVRSALAVAPGPRALVMSADPQARFLAPEGLAPTETPYRRVEAVTISQLMAMYAVYRFDVVKLDIEGSEYGVLQAWPGDVATQISVEFHEHVQPRPQAVYDAIFEHLGRWYDVVQHEKTKRHCTSENWWDTLLTLRRPPW